MLSFNLKNILFVFVLLIFSLTGQTLANETDAKILHAIGAAEIKLNAMSSGDSDLDEGYASTFKEEVRQSQWTRRIEYIDETLGGVVSREMIYKEHQVSPEGFPEGEYVFIVYKTVLGKFTNRHESFEKVVMVYEDGLWRLAAYSIS